MSWYDWIPSALDLGAQLLGNSISNDATNEAAQIEADAMKRGAQAEVDAANEAKGYYAASKVNDQNMQQTAAPGVYQQQRAIVEQNVLTPAQKLAIDEARRKAVGALNNSSLRGSGRATVAAVKDVDNTMRTGYMDQNRTRADTAASALSQQYFTAGRDVNTQNANSATAGINAGKAVNTGIVGAAKANSGAVTQVADNDSFTSGKAIRDIAAQIAEENKKHASSYTNPTESG